MLIAGSLRLVVAASTVAAPSLLLLLLASALMAAHGCASVDTDETPQLTVALTHDLCDEDFLHAMGWRKLERAEHTAETPQLAVATIPHLVGGDACAHMAAHGRASVDADETPQLKVALTRDLCGEDFVHAMGWRKLERAEHTAETPQLAVATTPHLVGGGCASDAARSIASSVRMCELPDDHDCAPPSRKKRALVLLSPARRACGPVAGCAPVLGNGPVVTCEDELVPPRWRAFVHAIRLASARGEYGKLVMDNLKLLRSLPAPSQGSQGQIECAECEVRPKDSVCSPGKAHAPCVFVR